MLLAIALIIKFVPAWSTIIAFLIAPSLFLVAFAIAQNADEKTHLSWHALLRSALPGAWRLAHIALKFAVGFALGMGGLAWIASTLTPDPAVAAQQVTFEQMLSTPPLSGTVAETSPHVMLEFIHFCATWTEGVMAMMFLGMFIVAIYQGIFGVILHAQQDMNVRESRLYGWQAWQVNSATMEQAVREAPSVFWHYLAALVVAIICAFQTVYLSPIGLLLATYMPCLAYVAYRSIFFGKHENVPAAARSAVERRSRWIPAFARRRVHDA